MSQIAPSPEPVRPEPIALLRRVILTWFGCGRSPYAPGTVGSLGALPFGWVIHDLVGSTGLLIMAALLFIVGWRCANAELPGDDSDPGWVVADEVVGMWITLAATPFTLPWVIAGFVLFRFFDIRKPWPVSWADGNIGGGFGVMLDDVFAAVYAAGIVLIARALLA